MLTTPQPTPSITPRLVDVHGVAQLYSISERSVWRLSKLGQLPAPVHFGRRATRWRLEDLLEHIRKLETEGEVEDDR